MSNHQKKQAPRASRVHSSPRDNVLSRGPRAVPPAWRQQQQDQIARTHEKRVSVPSTSHIPIEKAPGCILVQNLPFDATPGDVSDLFDSTVGPLEESYLLYNNQGKSKGMAIVQFKNEEHAWEARRIYHGQIVDSQRPLRIRVIVDDDAPPKPNPQPTVSLAERITQAPSLKRPAPISTPHVELAPPLARRKASLHSRPQVQSLVDRLGPPVGTSTKAIVSMNGKNRGGSKRNLAAASINSGFPMGDVDEQMLFPHMVYPYFMDSLDEYQRTYQQPQSVQTATNKNSRPPRPARDRKMKKGPRRTTAKTNRLALLDAEMDAYRLAAPNKGA